MRRSKLLLSGVLALSLAGPARCSSPPYSDTAESLQRFIEETLAESKAGNDAEVLARVQGMALPKPEDWLKSVWGEEKGAELAISYKKKLETLDQMAGFFPKILQSGETVMRVTRFEKPEDAASDPFLKPVLEAMRSPVAIYQIQFFAKLGDTKSTGFGAGVFVDGAFRILPMNILLSRFS